MAAPTKITVPTTGDIVHTKCLDLAVKADAYITAQGGGGEAAALAALKVSLAAVTDATYA